MSGMTNRELLREIDGGLRAVRADLREIAAVLLPHVPPELEEATRLLSGIANSGSSGYNVMADEPNGKDA